MIHVKDVFAVLAQDRPPPPLLDLLRQPLYVPQSMGVLDLLAEMRAKRTHLAIVIDEYSGTEGLLTIEDLVEEIVGEIEDEHDDEPILLFTRDDDGCWEAMRAPNSTILAKRSIRGLRDRGDVATLGGLSAVLRAMSRGWRGSAPPQRLADRGDWKLTNAASIACACIHRLSPIGGTVRAQRRVLTQLPLSAQAPSAGAMDVSTCASLCSAAITTDHRWCGQGA